MFCYQCEQTAKGTGCTVQGVCGKQPEVAALQDLLLYTLMGLSQVATEGRKAAVIDRETNVFTVKAAFSTLTNVDFDPDRFAGLINEAVALRDQLKEKVKAAGGNIGFADGACRVQTRIHPRWADSAGAGRRPEILSRGQSRYSVLEAHGSLRHQRGQRLCRPCPDSGQGGRYGFFIHP